MSDAPKPTGNVHEVTLTGKLFPWDNHMNQPVLLAMPGSEFNYLPLFSTVDALRELMERANVPFDKIKHVDDGPEFMSSIPLHIKLICDPYFLDNGRVRFTEVFREPDVLS
jgi:hypothetical protein